MANLIKSWNLNKKYNINSYPAHIFVVCDIENNPVTFSPKGYGTWRKPKMMYFTKGHAEAQAKDLNKCLGEEAFKVVEYIPKDDSEEIDDAVMECIDDEIHKGKDWEE